MTPTAKHPQNTKQAAPVAAPANHLKSNETDGPIPRETDKRTEQKDSSTQRGKERKVVLFFFALLAVFALKEVF